MEKKLYDLKIDPELRDYIPRLTDQELELLTDILLEEGCNEPLTVWNGVIVDGHNRYRICKEHGIPFEVKEKKFENKQKAKFWMVRKQLGRRNLKPFQKCEAIYPFEQSISEEVEKRRRESIGKYRNGDETGLKLNQSIRTGDYMAKYANVSRTIWHMAKTIIEEGDDALKAKVRNGDTAISAAYKALRKKEAKKESKKQIQPLKEETKSDSVPEEKQTMHEPPTHLEQPFEVPSSLEEPEKTPRPFQFVRDQVWFSVENMLKELKIGLNWLRTEDADKTDVLLEILDDAFERAERMIKEEMA